MNMQVDAGQLVRQLLREPACLASLPPGQVDLGLRLLRRLRLLAHVAEGVHSAAALDSLPNVVSEQLTNAMTLARARAQQARWELNRIDWALAAQRPQPLIALKGCAYLLAALPNATGRLFADVDLMMARPQVAAVEKRLLSVGWSRAPMSSYDERFYREWAHEIPPLTHSEREVELDLHHNIVMSTAPACPDSELLLEAARPIAGTPFHVLAPVDMSLHAIAHLFHGGEVVDSLRELVDIDGLVTYYGQREPGFWEEFWRRAAMLKLARPAYYGLKYAQMLLGTPIPGHVWREGPRYAPGRIVRRLMDELVPRALMVRHPEHGESFARRVATASLYVRSHWLKMPPAMLVRHLSRKFLARQRDRLRDPET